MPCHQLYVMTSKSLTPISSHFSDVAFLCILFPKPISHIMYHGMQQAVCVCGKPPPAPEERWSFLTWSSSDPSLHKEESLTILFPNTNLEVLGQVSLKRRPKAQGVGPLNPGGLHSRKEQDCLGSSYKHFQEGWRPEMKPFPPPSLALSRSTWSSLKNLLCFLAW